VLVRAGSARHREPLVLAGHERSRPVRTNAARSTSGPQVMATMGNLAIGLLRLAAHPRSPHAGLGSTGIPPPPGVPRPPMNPLAPQTRLRRGPGRPGTRISISHQRHAMGALFEIGEHEMAEPCGPVRGSR
jgi:hypothetical protein